MNVRFYNARILTMKNGTEITEGELWTRGDFIHYIGPVRPSYELRFGREIDVKGNVIIPGFKNAHAHSPMTFLRSYADDLPLKKWLKDKVFPLEAKLDEEKVYHLSKLAFLEYISGGITSSFDMYFEPEGMACAAKDIGFRLVMCGAVNSFRDSVDKTAEYYDRYKNYDKLISYQLGFHAEYTTKIDILRELARFAIENKAPVYSHNSETKKEVEECLKRHGKTPTELFEELGLFENSGGGFHCVHVGDDDIKILKRNKIWVVTNPASNLKLASGIAPLVKLKKAGIDIAVGTDGPASNNALDMFREMYLATVLQKYSENDAAAMPAEDVLTMAVSDGANMMGLKKCASLEETSLADLAIIDLRRPNMQPLNNIIKNIVYSGNPSNVKLTMISGKILYENGEFYVGEPVDKIYEKANEIIKSCISA